MSTIPKIVDSNLPEDGLRFFHGLANWVERVKGLKLELIEWKKGHNKLTILNCNKSKQKEPLCIPEDFPDNTMYVPCQYSGRQVISQLRHAFCHSNLKYDDKSEQYSITRTDNVRIAGKFSLDAIREFVNIYLEPKELKNNTKQ